MQHQTGVRVCCPVYSAVLMQACWGICPITRGLRVRGRMQQAGTRLWGRCFSGRGKSRCVGVNNVFVGLRRNLQAVIIEQLGPFRNPLPSSGHGQSRGKLRLKQHNQARQQDLCLLQVAGQGWGSARTHTRQPNKWAVAEKVEKEK